MVIMSLNHFLIKNESFFVLAAILNKPFGYELTLRLRYIGFAMGPYAVLS